MKKVVTTVIAILWHLILGLKRVVEDVFNVIVFLVAIPIMLISEATIRGKDYLKDRFSDGYMNSWNSIYAKIFSPTCEMCGKKEKVKEASVMYHHCCGEFLHRECHVLREVVRDLNENMIHQVAANIALYRFFGIDVFSMTLIKGIRSERSPSRPSLYSRLHAIKRLSEGMDFEQACVFSTVHIDLSSQNK